MYKVTIKVIDLSTIPYNESTYTQFKNNIASNMHYVETLESKGYKPEYISFNDDQVISTRYTSIFWLMALKIIHENYVNDNSHTIPENISIQVIDFNQSVKLRTNQKWLVPISYIYQCDQCKKLFDKDCSCIK